MPECEGCREKENCGGFFCLRENSLQRPHTALVLAMKTATARLPISPSKTLVKFADQIASFGKGPVVDAPCGYGRNAVALAARGCTVLAVDNNQVKAANVAEHASAGVSNGQNFTICADLTAEGWPVAPSSVSAIIYIYFAMIDLVPSFISSLQVGGYIYVETFGGQGQNFRELPKAGQVRELLSRHVEFRYYKEREVGPTEFDCVSVTLFAQRRQEVQTTLRRAAFRYRFRLASELQPSAPELTCGQ